MVALIVVGVKIYVDRIEKERQEQAVLKKQRQEQVAERARLAAEQARLAAAQAEKQRREQAAALEKQRQEQTAEQAALEQQRQEQIALEKQRQEQAAGAQARLATDQAEKTRQGQQVVERARIKEEILEFYMVEQKPRVVHQVNPVYPELARKAGLTGKVFLKFLVDKNGRVSNVTVLRGQEIFRQAAIDAALQFRFEPAKHNGKPVSTWMTLPMSFRLN